MRLKPITVAEPGKEAALVFPVIICVFAVAVFWHAVLIPTFQLERSLLSIDVIHVLRGAFYRALLLLPMIIAMRSSGQNLGSIGIGISTRKIVRMFTLGFALSLIYLTVAGFINTNMGSSFSGLSASLASGLVYFSIVGFSEEIVFRGYVQTRLVAYGGTLKGLVATSLLFALTHFPIRYYQHSGVVLEALASSLLVFPISLLFGYIMLRSQNVIPSSISHLFYGWNLLLWQ